MSRNPIQDEFTNLQISRQRKYQLRMARDGRCTKCGEPAVTKSHCQTCLDSRRETQRTQREEKLRRRTRRTQSRRAAARPKVSARAKRLKR